MAGVPVASWPADEAEAAEDTLYPVERLAFMREREERFLASGRPRGDPAADAEERFDGSRPPPQLDAERRSYAIQFLAVLVGRMGLPSLALAQAVANLDILSRLGGSAFLLAELPDTCIVLCCTLYKSENGYAPIDWDDLEKAAAWFRQLLGGSPPPVQKEGDPQKSYASQEIQVLEALGWQLHASTVEEWLRAFGVRFDAVTRGLLARQTAFHLTRGCQLAQLLMLRVAAIECSPRDLALGLLCSAFVSSGLLSPETFREPSVTEHEWAVLLLASQGSAVPQCVVPSSSQLQLLQWLRMATTADLAEMKECTLRCARLVHEC